MYASIATGTAMREVRPRRRHAEVDVVDEDLRAEDEHEAERDEQDLRREVDHREHDRQRRRLLDADDVEDDEHDDDDAPPTMSHGFVLSGSQKIER